MKRAGLSPELAALIAARNEQKEKAGELPRPSLHCECDHDGNECGGRWHLAVYRRSGTLLTVCSHCVFGDDIYVGVGYVTPMVSYA